MLIQSIKLQIQAIKIHIYVSISAILLGVFFVLTVPVVDAQGFSGTLYENDGVTPITSGKTVTAVIPDTRSFIGTTTVWAARSAAGNNDSWQSVAYGTSTYVAVGSTGDRVMTSPDGITWTARSAAGDNDEWYEVTYGNGLFVAVANYGDNRVMTSPDGITWTARSAAGNNDNWTSITYGTSTFVAVSNGGDRVMTSPDGINWTVRSAAGNNDSWQSVIYAEDLFVAVGNTYNGDIVMTSPDGINWTARSAAGNNDYWNSVTYGNGTFVAVGNYGDRIMTSPDGITWTIGSPPASWYGTGVTYSNGLFVAVSSYNNVMTSPDGTTWTPRSAAGNNDQWTSITYGGGLFVAVGFSGDRVMTAINPAALGDEMPLVKTAVTDGSGDYSIDPIVGVDDWTIRTAAGNNDFWQSIAYGNGRFVAVGAGDGESGGDRIMTSSDGITWTPRTVAGNDSFWSSVTYGNGLFVAVGIADDPVITSPDGITWTSRSAADNNDFWQSVTYGNGLFVAVGISGDRVMTSPDGTTWTVRSAADNNDFWSSVTYGNGTFVAVGSSGDRVMTSTNGTTWTARSAADNNDYWTDVTYGNGTFVAVGSSGDRVMTSTNGTTWTARSAAGNDDEWHGITYGNGTFVAVGAGDGESGGDRVMTSTNGTTWTARSAAGNDDVWEGITYGNNSFVSVGIGDGESGGDRVMTARVPDEDASVTLYIDGDTTTKTTTITQLEDSVAPNDLNLYKDTVSVQSAGTIDFTSGGFYDANDNASVLFDIDSYTTTITSDLRIQSGTLRGTNIFYAGGDITNLGILNFSNTTLSLNGTAQQTATGTLSGTSAIDQLTIQNTSGDGAVTQSVVFGAPLEVLYQFTMEIDTSVQFLAGATNTLERIEIAGAPDNEVYLRSSSDGDAWYLDVPGEQLTIEYVNVKDSHAASTIFTTSSFDAGNNVNWDFPSTGTATTGALSGTLYENDGITPIMSGKTVTAAIAAGVPLVSTTTTDGSGNFSIDPITGVDTWTAANYSGYWNSVTYGNGLFVAVSDFSIPSIMTSPDGVTWTTRSAPDNDGWNSVTYGNGLFVAVADYGDRVMTSPDGITWTARSAADDDDEWHSVTYGNGLFVAVGDTWYGDDSIMTSPDGINWTVRTLEAYSDGWYGVTYGNGLFVAVGINGSIITSPDGINWTVRKTADYESWQSVTYGNGLFVTVGSNQSSGGVVITSPDGITWTARSAAGNNDYWNSVTYGNGFFIAVGCGPVSCNDSTSGDRVMTSPDGITWTPRSVTGNNDAWTSVAFGGNTFAVVGRSGDNRVVSASVPAADAVITLYVDGDETKATTLTRLENYEALDNLHLFEDVVRVQSPNTINLTDDIIYAAAEDDDVLLAIDNGSVISADLMVVSGTLQVTDRLSVTGDLTNQSALDVAEAKVFLTGTDQQMVSGSTVFNDLTITNTSADGTTTQSVVFDTPLEVTGTYEMTPGSSAQFLSGTTSTLKNIDLKGTSNDAVYLRSSNNGSPWYLDVPAEQITVEYVNVKDSFASTTITANNSIDEGNNTNWSFATIDDTAATGTLSGTLYENDGVTPITSGKTVTAAFADSRPFIPSTIAWEEDPWTIRPAADDNDFWTGVVYGNDTFVAVGYSGDRVITSPDGINWTVQSAADDDDNWTSVTYGEGLFVAVGYSGDNRVMTSPDGITWTAQSAAGNDDSWQSVTYGNGTFVAVGDDGDRVMTSPDGITWTVQTADGLYNYYRSVTYGNDTFVAVGTYNDVMTSPDGITWTAGTVPGDSDWAGVAYGNGTFVAVGNYGDRVITSPDGAAWTVQSAVGNNDLWNGVTYSNGTFVAVAYSGDNRVMTSPDGITWTAQSADGDNDYWNEVAYGNGLFVAVGDYVMTAAAPLVVSDPVSVIRTTTSDDSGNFVIDPVIGADEWTAQSAAGDNDSWRSVIYANNTFVAVAYSGDNRVMTSSDGITWDVETAAGDNDQWQSVTYGDGLFVAVGNGDDYVMTSPDGTNWTAQADDGSYSDWSDVTYGDGLFVAVGGLTGGVMTSPDGITWTTQSVPGNNNVWYSVTYGNNTFVAVGDCDIDFGFGGQQDCVMTSPDGVTWTARSAAGDDDVWYSVTYGNNTFVAVANYGDDYVMTSPDGITWTARNAGGNNDSWRSVTYSGSLFVAVGSSGDRVMTSPDGITWTAQTDAAGDNDDWNSVTYGNNTFVAVGLSGDRVMTTIVPTEDVLVTLYVDGDPDTKATTLTKIQDSHASENLNLYDGVVALHIEGTIDLTSDAFYDATDDADILIDIDTSTTSIGSESIMADLLVATGTTLIGSENLSLHGDFINSGSLDLADSTLHLRGIDPSLIGSFVGANALGDVVIDARTGGDNWAILKNGYFDAITYGDNLFVAIGDCGYEAEDANCVMTSPDGITWTPHDAAGNNDTWSGITYGNGLFVAVGSCSPEDLELEEEEDTDCVMTSPDGINWTAYSALDADDEWYDIAYGNGIFVATGSCTPGKPDWGIEEDPDCVMISPDGINWATTTAAGDDDEWSDITYGNGLFVAVGSCSPEIIEYGIELDTDCVMTSPDGISWATTTAASDKDHWSSVTYGDGLFVAVGSCSPGDPEFEEEDDTDCVMTSPDGITWTGHSALDADDTWSSVTYGNGLFVAAGFSAAFPEDGNTMDHGLMTSPDGVTWTDQGAYLGWWSDVVYGNGMFVVAGNGVAITEPIASFPTASTSDLTILVGKNFTTTNPLSIAGNLINDGEFNSGEALYLTGSNKTLSTVEPTIGNVIVTGSIDFLSNASTSNLTVETGGTLEPYNALTINGDFTQNGSVEFSDTVVYLKSSGLLSGNMTDGNAFGDLVIDPGNQTSWTGYSAADNDDAWISVTYGDDLFVAVGDCVYGGDDCVMTSSDGIIWTAQSAAGNNDGWSDITYGNGLFVAIGDCIDGGDDCVMTSPDGINWSPQSVAENDERWCTITYGNGLFVAVSCQGDDRIMTSPDGINWTVQSTDAESLYDITFGNGLFVTVGSCGFFSPCAVTSEDGITWTTQTIEVVDGFSWSSVTYGNGLFVATGENIITSEDGITWTTQTFSGENTDNWYNIAYGNGLFVVIGDCAGYGRCGRVSSNGINWAPPQTIAQNSGDWYGIAYGAEEFVIVGVDGESRVALFTRGTTTVSSNVAADNLSITAISDFRPSAEVVVKKNFTNSGMLTANTSEFIFAGNNQQTVGGNMTGTSAFNDLTIANVSGNGTSTQSILFTDAVETSGTFKMEAGSSAQFPAGSTSTLQHIDLQGSLDNEVYLRSSSDGSQWYIDVPGDQVSVEYVNVKDSYASSTIITASSSDAGNNINWQFGSSTEEPDETLYDTLTIDHTQIDDDLTDFPVYVDLSDLSAQFWSNVHSDGGNIRIMTDDMSAELPREIVSISTSTETGELHFKANHIDSDTDTVFRIYYNGAGEDYLATDPYGRNNVWSNGFIAVYHLEEDGSVTPYIDATGHSHPGIPQSIDAGDKVSGALGSGLNTDGNPEGIIIEDSALFDWTHGSISGWLSTDTLTTDGNLANRGAGGSAEMILWFDEGVDDLACATTIGGQFYNSSIGGTYTPRSTGEWLHGFCSWDGDNLVNYVNGVPNYTNGTPSGSLRNDNVQAGIAREPLGARYLDGQVDEVRFHNTGRTAAWVKAEYLNQSAANGFYTAGTPTITLAAHDEGQVLNAFTSGSKINEELFAFKLIPNSGTATVTDMVINLSGAKKIATSSFSNITLVRDDNNDGTVDFFEDTPIDGAGTISLSGQTGTITFLEDFLLEGEQNFIVVGSWSSPSNGAFLQVDLLPTGVTAPNYTVSGNLTGVQHGRNNRGGGGSPAAQIGGEPPASPDVGGGDEGGGGEQIGNNPDYKIPGTHSGSWSRGNFAYDGINGTYSTTITNSTHNFSGMDFEVANGATIDGLEVRLEASGSSAAGNIQVQLSWDGGASWTTAKSTGTLSTSDIVTTLGGPSDKWGRQGWTLFETGSETFRVRVTGAPSSNTVQIDEIRVRIYSSVSGGGGGGGGDI